MFTEPSGPQPPKILTTAAEIYGSLKTLNNHLIPLKIRFAGREHPFLSYVAAIDRDSSSLAYDELVPADGTRMLLDGKRMHVEAMIDGVRLNWSHENPAIEATLNEHKCYWLKFPEEIRYHQRRATFRANISVDQPASIELRSAALPETLTAKLLDISATGCQVRFEQLATEIKPGQLFDDCTLLTPNGRLNLGVEIRHIQQKENQKSAYVGLRFHNMDGITQRNIERFVYQLQREARRNE